MKHLLALAAALALTACSPNYEGGTTTGFVETIELEGPTWELTLLQTLDEHGHQPVENKTVGFNVKDLTAVQQLKAAKRDGKQVEIVYQQFLSPPVFVKDQPVVTSVRVLD